ncbi:TlpA disulfide reductase family protein [Comamonas sp. NLF-1-9]|uniref:TlpA family protein disulfide reductase n=1 Tax=Comamonas sp. NLF-1-9 TaxID=2853163 RepID=UPI001C45E9D1|nr:TlpA disulfide reductase family protein [Comamonas sp. NLF-1-9]QXL84858.1 TlpA family protein disulfide reductase [Comamonas sp. NLF-1-9]
MERTLALGPLALPWSMLLLMLAWLLGSLLHEGLARRRGLGAGMHHSWLMLLAVLLAARIGYVLAFANEYAAAPWGVLDVRDGGWSPWWGLSMAISYLLFLWASASRWRATVSVGALAALLLWGGGWFWLHRGPPAGVEPTATAHADLPDWQGEALDGSTLALSALKGQPVVLNFWATWCPPCRREMPVLLQASRERPQVRFLWINQGEDKFKAGRYAQQQGLPPASVLLDADSALSHSLGLRALPTTLFYDAQGRLVASRVGELSAATLAERLRLAGAGR